MTDPSISNLELSTPDITRENVERLAELFPSVATEVADAEGNPQKAIDFDALRDLLGDVAEGQRERYQFTWPGKAEAKLEARKPCDKTLRPHPEKSVDWDTTQNVYIEGDNLDALKVMRETYASKVKLIYIDPPYNTGHDFIYDDDFAQTREEYDAQSGEYDEEGGRLVANTEGNGRFHSDWCSMMYPRLLLARDLLSNDGAIFISIDDNESANLRKICDEVFGAECFVANVIWQNNTSPRNDAKGIPYTTDNILIYSKGENWQPKKLPRTEDMDSRYENPDGDPLPWTSSPYHAPSARTHRSMVYAVQHPFNGELIYPPNGRCWSREQAKVLTAMNEWAHYELRRIDDVERRASICGVAKQDVPDIPAVMLVDSLEDAKVSAEQRMAAGNWPEFYFTGNGAGGLRVKKHLDFTQGKVAASLWPANEVGTNTEATNESKKLFDGSAPFDTPKPVRLMDRILTIASNPDSLVLDFFSGSASMAEAVIRKNAEDGGTRRFALVQIPEKASGEYATLCDIGEERICRAGKKIAEEVDVSNRQLKIGESLKPIPDIGFRVFSIDSSNFLDTYIEPGEQAQASLLSLVDNLKEDRTPEDLLFQVLPAFRIPYSARVEKMDVAGATCFNVNDGQLIACFDMPVSTDAIEKIAQMKPIYAVFRDASFASDSDAANFEELFKTYSPDTVRRVI